MRVVTPNSDAGDKDIPLERQNRRRARFSGEQHAAFGGSVRAIANNFESYDFSSRRGVALSAGVTAGMRRALNRYSSSWEKRMAVTPLLIDKTKDGQVLVQAGLPPAARLNALLDQLAPSALQNHTQ